MEKGTSGKGTYEAGKGTYVGSVGTMDIPRLALDFRLRMASVLHDPLQLETAVQAYVESLRAGMTATAPATPIAPMANPPGIAPSYAVTSMAPPTPGMAGQPYPWRTSSTC